MKKSGIIQMLLKALETISPRLSIFKRCFLLFPHKIWHHCVWDKGSCVTLNCKTEIFPLHETCFKGKGFKEVTERRNKRGRGSDQYWVLIEVDRETQKSFSKIPDLCHLGVRQITPKLNLLFPVPASSSRELCGTVGTWL